MDPISNADRIAALLRQRLLDRARGARTEKSGPGARTGTGARAQAGQGVRALAAVEGGDERRLKRMVIEHILAEQFGEALINEARFQRLVEEVTAAIDGEDGGAALLDAAIAELRAKG